jgi:hypothetical protein
MQTDVCSSMRHHFSELIHMLLFVVILMLILTVTAIILIYWTTFVSD